MRDLKIKFLIIATSVVVVLSACQTTEESMDKMASLDCSTAPLPEFTIVQPASDVPKELARFSGLWKGKWDGILCSRLVITSIEADGTANGIYAWAPGRNFNAGYDPFEVKISDNNLKFGTNAKFSFSFEDNQKEVLHGRRVTNNYTNIVSMVRDK
tara:strand:+ start:611 stop:1078 length:468 start_codon:yes stop_codon:yes gene_type:complete